MIQHPHLEGGPFYWMAGPTGVVLIHGFTATTAEMRPLARILQEHGYSVLGVLLPGHNTTPDDLNRVHWRDWVRASEAGLREIQEDCDVVFVGGESTGGLAALYMASEHPEIAGIMAYAPALRLTYSRWDIFRLRLLSPFVPSIPKANIDESMPWQGYTVNPLRGARQLLAFQKAVQKRLDRIHQPLLIVQGRLDPTVHHSVPETLSESVRSPMVKVLWMERSKHVVVLDQELPQVAQATLDFIEQVMEVRHGLHSNNG